MKRKFQHLFSALLLAGFTILAFGSGDDNKEKEEKVKEKLQTTEAIEINARQLYSEYEANGVLADKNYKDKALKVTGIVDNIDKDIMDQIYVTLNGDEYVGDIQCFFSEEYLDQAAELKKGQKITVTGVCEGKMMNVVLKGCTIN